MNTADALMRQCIFNALPHYFFRKSIPCNFEVLQGAGGKMGQAVSDALMH